VREGFFQCQRILEGKKTKINHLDVDSYPADPPKTYWRYAGFFLGTGAAGCGFESLIIFRFQEILVDLK
jgi:hypothetical protein